MRYRADPRRVKGKVDLAEIIEGMNKRISAGETAWRAGNTAIENGNLVVRNGDIVVSLSDDTEVLRILHGDVPEIRYMATGVDTDRFGAVWGEDVTIDLGSGFGNVDTTVMHMGVYDTAIPDDHVPDGGEVILHIDAAKLEYNPNNGDNSVSLWLNTYSRVDPFKDIITMQGKWDNGYDFSSQSAMSAGSFNVSAGFSSLTWTYIQTFDTTIAPVVGLVNTAGLVTSWNITAMSNSDFTVTWSGTLAKTVNFWNPRLT